MKGISHLSYDLNNYASSLKRKAHLAASFFIEDSQLRMSYLKEVDDFVNIKTREFKNTFDVNEKKRLIYAVKDEYEITEKEYQALRRKDYTKYIVTDIFEDQGVVKYAKIGGGVVAGIAQTAAGIAVINSGRIVRSKRVQLMGAVLVAHGGSNFYEAISPILYENQKIGLVRKGYRYASHALGYGDDVADVAYSSVDLVASLYGTYGVLKLKPVKSKNNISGGYSVKPGTGKLFRYINSDLARKWQLTPKPMLTIQVLSSGYKVKLLIDDINKLHDD
ncbi:DUF4225 domain-containing protein [Photorhabdus laumondii subsp. laumondii]|uniref:Photorhabdus luminescens subsp. laumondii TTO1 complete genome segment 11/17 n=2 Tax=Photorhabdus laumondii subsp. laumondii TaxID=141679 RepID=Q7N2U7_PHOLL|nr:MULTISPECIES: DUF4225 domain-containing protein [Photorhabdus]AWK42684.1 hypothetical protein A4R40_14875 [Photorhabdus laumondii subsp. laumondii]AXG43462.1 DUF4225 domain-containing protein [Photorhabdus laumondii subsp. laumondii]AXG48004.1 DUF4225 domain-containing protein [Photorhabdus laumondii subsp. laumondii]KTL63253.1 hypothetical protein AA106_17655 [Photorhabdus laumondii subsp. laumondii]MCC8386534.1 DUF4225 domain-containing protein [Photorhabdus laumondii]